MGFYFLGGKEQVTLQLYSSGICFKKSVTYTCLPVVGPTGENRHRVQKPVQLLRERRGLMAALEERPDVHGDPPGLGVCTAQEGSGGSEWGGKRGMGKGR